MKYNGPKARKCRRQGMNLYGSDKYDKILQRKPSSPGKGPRAQQGRLSEYGKQLLEKQKARDMYGLSERQFRSLYALATKTTGKTGDVLRQLLERRLDNAVYRSGFAMTRLQARQLVGHGLFLVDGTRVTIPSFRVKPGQVITVRPTVKQSPLFAGIQAAHQKYNPPSWLKVDGGGMRIEVAALPSADDAERAVDVRQIIEFYSRT
ncbi:MAG: small subunit ribosomal protein S4 [Candidatus Peregrinibacteria bacterium Greene0416_19]|nr:MAG: small subunit ribosomal protein S4 [Candidatus Peregrinibacteria bacterium Greene0416_19]